MSACGPSDAAIAAALSENICGGESRGARAYDDGCASVPVLLEQVALVADKRVDGAIAVSADKRICLHRFKAVEAANAATDCFAVNSLFGPVRDGDVRSAEGNEVLNAVL